MRLNPDLLPCPECGQQTDSLKGYRLPTFLLFILVAASFKHALVDARVRTCVAGRDEQKRSVEAERDQLTVGEAQALRLLERGRFEDDEAGRATKLSGDGPGEGGCTTTAVGLQVYGVQVINGATSNELDLHSNSIFPEGRQVGCTSQGLSFDASECGCAATQARMPACRGSTSMVISARRKAWLTSAPTSSCPDSHQTQNTS